MNPVLIERIARLRDHLFYLAPRREDHLLYLRLEELLGELEEELRELDSVTGGFWRELEERYGIRLYRLE